MQNKFRFYWKLDLRRVGKGSLDFPRINWWNVSN